MAAAERQLPESGEHGPQIEKTIPSTSAHAQGIEAFKDVAFGSVSSGGGRRTNPR